MPSSKPLVSVILPTYNRAAFIEEAIDSVLSQDQTGSRLELIVIDDGSTDSTEEILKKYGTKIKYLKIPHSGLPAKARNAGLNIAKGDIVAFQDSDDVWAAGKLKAQLSTLDNPDVVLSYGNAEFMSADGKRLKKTIIDSDMSGDGWVFDKLVAGNMISTLTVMACAKAIKELGGFNESKQLRGVEDYELWLRLALRGRFYYSNRTLAYYRQHEMNISTKDPVASYKQLVNVYKSILKLSLNHSQKLRLHQRLGALHKVNQQHLSGAHLWKAKFHNIQERLLAKVHRSFVN